MKNICRPRYVAALFSVWVATVIAAVMWDPTSVFELVAIWAVYAALYIFVTPRRRIQGQGVLACDCPRHLKEVPVEDREDWGSDKF